MGCESLKRGISRRTRRARPGGTTSSFERLEVGLHWREEGAALNAKLVFLTNGGPCDLPAGIVVPIIAACLHWRWLVLDVGATAPR